MSEADEQGQKSLADLMYGSAEALVSDFGPRLADSAAILSDVAGWTAEQRAEHVLEAARTFSEVGIRGGAAAQLHALVAQHARTPVGDETVEQWRVESLRKGRERYGEVERDRRAGLVKAYLAERPAIAQLLEHTGTGSHPKLFSTLLEQADRLPVKKR